MQNNKMIKYTHCTACQQITINVLVKETQGDIAIKKI